MEQNTQIDLGVTGLVDSSVEKSLRFSGLSIYIFRIKERRNMRKFVALLALIFTTNLFAAAPTVEYERDNILMLLSYSMVLKDWQSEYTGKDRGYNIGAVLYDEAANKIVGVQRNTTRACDDKTQHAEVRLMQDCLNGECRGDGKTRYLDKTTIYTTLEPCMMCSGMMAFLKVDRTLYGQADPGFGKNIERLKLPYKGEEANSRARNLKSIPAPFAERKQLDKLFAEYIERTGSDNVTAFLTTDEAKYVYYSAAFKLLTMDVVNKENESLYDQAMTMLFFTDDRDVNACFIGNLRH
ncbi:nucleoside deaminase [Sansalvadorimonas sp. 2012CJ34-2]|uniref:Nucleoside deaminase n=1 Tax=Parendozoicomonas callyspongiae TaxID=2942213 RepID=A0ABT0PDY4_9GAMM|nr:nucleoside deaminase [Sansalvadorimonas sp. 2012CJ34-2]MCL6268768.1 nucleoside deaminase [Sansalvadorimonas sp. 2012CJ34-2]